MGSCNYQLFGGQIQKYLRTNGRCVASRQTRAILTTEYVVNAITTSLMECRGGHGFDTPRSQLGNSWAAVRVSRRCPCMKLIFLTNQSIITEETPFRGMGSARYFGISYALSSTHAWARFTSHRMPSPAPRPPITQNSKDPVMIGYTRTYSVEEDATLWHNACGAVSCFLTPSPSLTCATSAS